MRSGTGERPGVGTARLVRALHATLGARPGARGRIASSGPVVAELGTDFGRLVHGRPQVVVRAQSTADVQGTLRVAAELGVEVTPRGRGGNTRGQTVASSGIALDCRGLDRLDLPDGTGPSGAHHTAVLGAGGTWDRAIDAIRWRGYLRRGYPSLQIPVVPGYKRLTVGGTLSVGGGGFRSHARGLQVDHVTEIEIVTGGGEVVVASPTAHPDLFFAALGGAGQVGVITRATLALVPDEIAEGLRLASYALTFADPEPFLAAILSPAVSEVFYEVQGNAAPTRAGPWRYQIKGSIDQRALAADALRRRFPDARVRRTVHALRSGRHARLESLVYDLGMKLVRRWHTPHPWATVFLPLEVAADFFTAQLPRVDRAGLGRLGFVTVVPTAHRRRPYTLLRLPGGDRFASFGIFYLPADAARARPLWAQLDQMRRDADAVGGKVYLGDLAPETVPEWERHFGAELDRVRALKRRYDPAGVLRPVNPAQADLFRVAR